MAKVCYRDSFKPDNAILITGCREQLLRFAEFLAEWSCNPGASSFSSKDYIELDGIEEVVVEVWQGSGAKGMHARSHRRFAWCLDSDGARSFHDAVTAVAVALSPSHAYLDSPDDEVSVIVSKGEYPV